MTVVMIVGFDESGRDVTSIGIDHTLTGSRLYAGLDLGNASIENANISQVGRGACAINDLAALDEILNLHCCCPLIWTSIERRRRPIAKLTIPIGIGAVNNHNQPAGRDMTHNRDCGRQSVTRGALCVIQ
jgi:hypothetical protein